MITAVLTGVGTVCAFGSGVGELWRGLAEGRSAVAPVRQFSAANLGVQVAGEATAADIDAEWIRTQLPPDMAITLEAKLQALQLRGALRDRKLGFAVVAAAEAWTMAGLGEADRDLPLILAHGLEHGFPEDFAPLLRNGRVDWRLANTESGSVRMRSPVDAAGRAIRQLFGLRGPLVAPVSACAAGAMAVADAAQMVARGEADLVLCGATDSMLNPLGMGGMARLGAPSPRAEVDACRPFDVRRDGLAMGEGAAVFVVENAERARARGATPLAVVLGAGTSQDAFRATAPLPDGSAAARAIMVALRSARLAPSELGYVNAHGTGTPLNDPAECRALHAALGAHAELVPVSSIKGAIGHLMAAAGAVEIAASLLAFQRDLLPGTAHHQQRDPVCDVDVIGEQPRRARIDVLLSNSFGFGGQNCAVVLGRAP